MYNFNQIKEKRYDYLKFYRPIFKYYRHRYKLTQYELDVLLAIYSEAYITKKRFEELSIGCGRDYLRLKKLLDRGFLQVFRKGRRGHAYIYQMTFKTQKMIAELYMNLSGDNFVSESKIKSNFFNVRVSQQQKNAQTLIKMHNESIRQQRRQTPE